MDIGLGKPGSSHFTFILLILLMAIATAARTACATVTGLLTTSAANTAQV